MLLNVTKEVNLLVLPNVAHDRAHLQAQLTEYDDVSVSIEYVLWSVAQRQGIRRIELQSRKNSKGGKMDERS